MTIDEAIISFEKVAEYNESAAKRFNGVGGKAVEKYCEECKQVATDHRQLAEWLRKLVAYKKIRMCGNCRHYVVGTTHFGECHVTSDIEPCVVGVNQNACDTFFEYKDLELESGNNDT